MPSLGQVSAINLEATGLVNQPVSLTYSVDSHQFELKVTGVSQVSYLLEYSSQNLDDKKIRNAVNKTGQADQTGVYTDTILAGTVSNQEEFFHDVVDGSLELIATQINGDKVRYLLLFEVDEHHQLQIISQKKDTLTEREAAQILGDQDETQPSSVLETLPVQTSQHSSVETPWYQDMQTNLIQVLPVALVVGASITAVSLYALYQKRKTIAGLDKKLN